MLTSQDLLQYLDEHGTTSEKQLAMHFEVTPERIAMMCERLAEKGRVRLITTGGCGKESGCTCGSHEVVRHWQRVVS